MKVLAIFLIVLCLAAFGGIWYLHVTSNVNVFPSGCSLTELNNDVEQFSKLSSQLEQGTFTGIRFSSEKLASPDDYLVYTWTVRLDNHTSLTARVAEIRVTPMKGYDILQFDPQALLFGSVPEYIIPPNSSIEVSVCVLTSRTILEAQSRPDMRDASVTWYFGGFPFPESNGKSGKLVLQP